MRCLFEVWRLFKDLQYAVNLVAKQTGGGIECSESSAFYVY